MNYEESLEYLSSLEAHGIKLGLQNMEIALTAFGNPEKKYSNILVAGTNGKGSTCAFLNRILIENKHKTGFYSSPHLVKYNERIQVNGKTISDKEFTELATKTRSVLETERLSATHFEFLTLMALSFFAQKKVEFGVLEVGMGGRLDATNTVPTVANAITNIGLDHQQYLGQSIRQIALEKAGIIKNNAPLVSCVSHPELRTVFADLASAKEAQAFFLGKDFSATKKPFLDGLETMDFKGLGIDWKNLQLSLFGDHQLENASLALAIAAVLKQNKRIRLQENAVRKALKKTVWPARFQVLSQNPIVVADCCHNPDGARVFSAALKQRFPNQKFSFVIGVSSDKAANQMLSSLLPLAQNAFFCEARFRKTPTSDLFAVGKEFLPAFKIKEIPAVKDAVKEAIKNCRPTEVVCVCGSIFVVGEALELKWPKPKKGKK